MFEKIDTLPRMEDGNTIFIDRDGSTFQALINYLRNEREEVPLFENSRDEHLFFKELKFWDFPEADYMLQTKMQFPQELLDIFKIEPGVENVTSGGLSAIAEVVSTPIHGGSQYTQAPGHVDLQVKQRWKELGPLNIYDLI